MTTSISSNSSSGQSYQSPSGSGMNVHSVKDALDQLMLAYASQQQAASSDAAKLAQIKAQQSTVIEQVASANASVNAIAQQYEAIAAQQSTTSNKVASIDASLTALTQQYSAIAAQQTSLDNQIAILTASSAAIAQQYAALSAGYTALQEQINALSNSFNWKNYQPALKGATSDPTVTYAHRTGRYIEIGKLIIFFCNFQSSTVVKASGLTDALRISLPAPCAAGQDVEATSTTVSTALGGIVGNTAYIKAGSSHLEVGKGLAGNAIGLLNYSLTGLGALNSTINYIATGVYERA